MKKVMSQEIPKASRLSAPHRRKALMQAAADVFFEIGFEAAKINDIIARAGGSKRAIYAEFGGKDGLFLELIKEKANSMVSPLTHAPDDNTSLQATLLHFAKHVLDLILSPEGIGIIQCIMAESVRFPELSQTYFASGPGRATGELAAVLQRAREQGKIREIDPQLAAEAFMGMLRGNVHLEVILRARPTPSEQEKEAIAKNTVDFFLHGILRG